MKLSVVIPVFNESESLTQLYKEIRDGLKSFKNDYEIIFVDDGSFDNSFDILSEFEKKNSNVKFFSFRKNLGKSYALSLGFKVATGNYIATLDADLQDDPRNIKILLEKLMRQKYDLISGWRKHRKDSMLKIAASRLFNKINSYIFNFSLHDMNSGLKVLKSEVAKELKLYGGMHRFIPLIVNELGYKVSEKEVVHRVRRYGVSKFKITKVVTDLPDLFTFYFLTKYTRRPLHFFGKFGGLLFIAGFLILLYLTFLKFLGEGIGNRPLLLLGILLVISGMQVVLTGLLADLLVRVSNKNDEQFPLRYESKKP